MPGVLLPFLVLAGTVLSCAPQQTRPSADGGPEIRATVVRIRTVIEPGDLKQAHSLIIVGDEVRATDEHDGWRLFNVKDNTVTFVDDIAKTRRTETLAEVNRKRRTLVAGPLPPLYPNVQVSRTGEKQPLLGVPTEHVVIQAGGYRREVWLGEHPQIPSGVYSMMYQSDPPSSPLIPMMSRVDELFAQVSGFPLADRTEVSFGADKTIVDRRVIAIEQRAVSASLIRIPADYLDLTPVPEPTRGRKTPPPRTGISR
ncbi:MAG TPA: hypothetical protein VF701_22135 [Thermoanaerobaculia bacterium]